MSPLKPFVQRYQAEFPTISDLAREVIDTDPPIEHVYPHTHDLPFHVYQLETPFNHRITVIHSPETRQLVIGGVGYEARNDRLVFVPSRRHDGYARAHNSQIFLEQAFASTVFRGWLHDTGYVPAHNIVLAPIMREGPLMSPHVAWFNVFGNQSVPPLNTVRTTHVGHGETRTNEPVTWFTEQFGHPTLHESRTNVHAVLFFDSAAGGTTMDVSIRKAQELFPHLHHIVLCSPYGSYQASVALSAACRSYGLEFSHITAHEALEGDHTAWYDVSPPTDPSGNPLLIDPRDTELLIAIYGKEVAFNMCTGGDFSSTLAERKVGAQVWADQLEAYNLTPDDIPVTPINPSTLAAMGYMARDIIPHSTYVEAHMHGLSPRGVRELFDEMAIAGQ